MVRVKILAGRNRVVVTWGNKPVGFSTRENFGSPYKAVEVFKINGLSKAKVSLHLVGLWHLTSGVQ